MNSYIIQVFGWESVFHTYQVGSEDVKVINQILKDNNTQDLIFRSLFLMKMVMKSIISLVMTSLNIRILIQTIQVTTIIMSLKQKICMEQ